jgi:hypothetical protein
LEGGKMMKNKQFKNTLCLALALSLVAGWFNINTSGAEEYQQPISEHAIRSEMELPPGEISGLSVPANQDETKELQKTKHKELLKKVGTFILALAALPVAVVAYYGVALTAGTICITYEFGREIEKTVKETFAPGKSKGGSQEKD